MLKKCFLICPKYLCKVRVQFQIILVIVNCLVLCQLLYKRRVLQPYSPMSAIIGISYSFSTSIHISNYRIIHINVVDNIACPHYVIKSASAVTCCILNLIFGQICTTVNVVCICHNKEIPIRITINPRQNVIFSNWYGIVRLCIVFKRTIIWEILIHIQLCPIISRHSKRFYWPNYC